MANDDNSAAMAISDFGTISVDPEVLRETAEAAFRQIEAYRRGLESLSKLIESSGDFWTGEAGDAYRQVFRTELALVEEKLDVYAAYPRELLAYAGVYSKAIEEAKGHAEKPSTFTMA